MPVTSLFAIFGALSLSGFPLFLGGVTLPMVLQEISMNTGLVVSVMSMIGMAGLVYGLSMRIPLNVFFGEDKRLRPKEAPFNMVVAMGLSAALCLLLALPNVIPGSVMAGFTV